LVFSHSVTVEVLMARTVDLDKVAAWQDRLDRFEAGQVSIAQFCRDEGVSQASFFSWRKKLASQKRRPQARQTTSASPGAKPPSAAFQAVRIVSAAGGLAVELRGGTKLQIPTSDPATLELAIQTLVHSDARLASGGERC
jgi:transposase-like protein